MDRVIAMKLFSYTGAQSSEPLEVIEKPNNTCKIYDVGCKSHYVATQDIVLDDNSKVHVENIDGVYYHVVEIDIIHREDVYSTVFISVEEFAEGHKNIILDLRHNNISNIVRINTDCKNHPVFRYIWFPEGGTKFKPVSIVETANATMHTEAFLKDLDTSLVVNFDGLMEYSDIEEFDFDSIDTTNAVSMRHMFEGCKKLKRVYGHIKSDNNIPFNNMFFDCQNLEEISQEVFEGVQTVGVNCMFAYCKKLRDNPINADNFKYIIRTGNTKNKYDMFDTYSECNSMNISSVVDMLNKVNKRNNIKYESMLGNLTGNIQLRKIRLSVKSGKLIFKGSNFRSIDMSKVQFSRSSTRSILDLFFSEDDVDDRSLPEFIIVNKTAPLNGADGFKCINTTISVVDMQGLSADEVKQKMALMSIMNSSSNCTSYVVIVDYK